MNTMQRAKYNDEYNEKSKANTYLLVIYQYDLVKLLLCNILTVTHSLKFQNFKNGWLSSDIPQVNLLITYLEFWQCDKNEVN